MPTKKKSCELVQQVIAGPTAGDVMEAIRSEYWLPQHPRQKTQASKPTPENTEPDTSKTKVKP